MRLAEIEEAYTDDDYERAMQDFLARGGSIEQGIYKEPRLKTRIRRQGSRHIGKGREPRAGQLSGRGANVGGKGKPVVTVEGLTWSRDFDPAPDSGNVSNKLSLRTEWAAAAPGSGFATPKRK